MQVKVCGITNIEQAQALDAMGVHYIGFIFYSSSKRYVLNSLSVSDLQHFKTTWAKKVGVFVNEPLDNLLNIVKEAGLDMVQLHGDEDLTYCEKVKEHVSVVKVFRVGALVPMMDGFDQVADYFLFDTDSALYGGTGQHFNWEIIKNQTMAKPYFLSGGIGPNDIKGLEVMQTTKAGKQLLAVDLNSQFEVSPGIKDLEKIKTFIHAII
ncbi:MAG: phosphoribosylanthranilate isomerase [Sediminibacterium sp.]